MTPRRYTRPPEWWPSRRRQYPERAYTPAFIYYYLNGELVAREEVEDAMGVRNLSGLEFTEDVVI